MSARPAFSFPIRIYWEDTDAGGVVYHAGYLRFLERARSEWLRALGIGQESLRQEQDRVFAVSAVELAFLQPARLDEELSATVRLIALGGASLGFVQTLTRPADAALMVRAKVRVACLQASSFRPARLPDEVLPLLQPWLDPNAAER